MKRNDFFDDLFSEWFGEWKSDYPKEGDKNYSKVEEINETPTHIVKREIWTSIDGFHRIERVTSTSKSSAKEKSSSKEDLELQLKEAIKSQEFEKACDIRDKLKKLSSK